MNVSDDALLKALTPGEPAVMDALARLGPAVRTELSTIVAESRERSMRDTRAAIDQALTHVPGILRGAVRKLLFPS